MSLRRFFGNGLAVAALLVFVFCLPGYSQVANGTIRGTVSDQSGAVLPNASVVLVNVGTAERYTQPTNKDGYYTFTDLDPAVYTVSVSAPAFESWQGTLTLRVAQEAVVNAKLKPGSVNETVTVNDVTPLVDAGDGTISDVKEATRIETLPLESSNFLNILNFSPGVVANSYGGQGGGYTRVNGIPGGSITFQVDGQSANDRLTNDLQSTPQAMQTIQELKVTTSDGSAEYSTPGVVDVVTKSGTNQLHGQVHEIYQTGGFEAQGYNALSSHLVHNDFGGQVGGPVLFPHYDGRNKTFFFFDANKQIQHDVVPDQELVPQQDWLKGDFSDYVDASGNAVTIYDPATGVYDPSTGYVTRTAFPQNQIPMGRMNSLAQKVLSYIPAPNINETNGVVDTSAWNWGVDWRNPDAVAFDDILRYTGKVDQVLGKNLLSARYTYTDESKAQPAFGGNSGTYGVREQYVNKGHNGVLSFTTPIGARAVNDAHVGVQLFNVVSGPVPDPSEVSTLKAAGMPIYQGDEALPGIYWNDQNQFALGEIDGPNPKESPNSNLTFGDNYSWTRGKHELKFGFQVVNSRVTTEEVQNAGGNTGFDGNFTGLLAPGLSLTTGSQYPAGDTGAGLADSLLGDVDESFYQLTPFFHTHQTDYDAFAQDNFKLSPRLTLNLGVRWEYWTPYDDAGGLSADLNLNASGATTCSVPYALTSGSYSAGPSTACVGSGAAGFPSWFTQTSPAVVIPNHGKGQNASQLAAFENAGLAVQTASQAGFPSSLWNMPKNNWSPRLGFAYQINDKTVLRGGYGIYYWTMPLIQYHQNTRDNAPWEINVSNQTDNNNPNGAELGFPFGPSSVYPNQSGQNQGPLPSSYVNPRLYGTDLITPAESTMYNTGGFSMAAWDPNFHAQQAQEYNVTIERVLPGNFAASVSYVGNHGGNLPVYDPINAQVPRELLPAVAQTNTWMGRPYPNFGAATTSSMDIFRFIGYSNHNEGRAELKHVFKGSFILQTYATWAKSMTSSEGTYNSYGGLQMEPAALTNNASIGQRLAAIYSPDSYIPGKTFVINGHYELPFGKGKQFLGTANTMTNELVSGWNTSVFYMWHSGLYFSPYYTVNPGLGSSSNEETLAPGNANRGILPRHQRTAAQWFNASIWDPCTLPAPSPCNFASAPSTYQGQTFEYRDNVLDWDFLNNIPRNYMTGPGFSNADGTLYKLTPIGEHMVFDLELQVFNVFNHTNLGMPNNGGTITGGIGTPRLLQFQGKITF